MSKDFFRQMPFLLDFRMSTIGRPFDDFRSLLQKLPEADAAQIAVARMRQAKLAKKQGALGKLEDIAIWLCGWQQTEMPIINKPTLNIFAGTNTCNELMSSSNIASTRQLVDNIVAGGAAINQICSVNDIGLSVYDLALEYPIGDIREAAAMDEKTCAATIAYGMETVARDTDLLCLGGMGNDNKILALAICCLIFGGDVDEWTMSTEIEGEGNYAQIGFIQQVVSHYQEENKSVNPFEVLRCVGGREFAAIIGAILAARIHKIPVLLDGLVVTTAAAILFKANPVALDHCLAGQVASEPGHRKLLQILGKEPILDLDLFDSEGAGAAMAASIVKSAALCHTQMASFEVDDN